MSSNSFNNLLFDGRTNHIAGLSFEIRWVDDHYVVSVHIKGFNLPRISRLNITMEPDQHKTPHIHISKGHNNHIASISLEGVFLNGEEAVTAKEKKIIAQWLGEHRIKLLELWNCVKEKRLDYPDRIMEINASWEYNGYVYRGQKPQKETCINQIRVWYNGKLCERPLKNGSVLIECTDDICIYRSLSPEEDKYLFNSVSKR